MTNPAKEDEPLWSETTDDGEFALYAQYPAAVLSEVLELYGDQSEVSFNQHPEWDDLAYFNGDSIYFAYIKSERLAAFGTVRIPSKRIARIEFGPVANSPEAALEGLKKLIPAIKAVTGVWYLSLQLPWQTGEDTEFVETGLRDAFPVKTFDDKRNWSSSFIDTHRSNEELLKDFSKNHKRSVKKAEKLGLAARVCSGIDEIEAFNDIFIRMYAARGETIESRANLESYIKLNEFFERTGNGFFFGVFQEDTMIGGMIIIKQGDYGFYHHSASDPDHRKIPVLHLGVFSVLDALRERDIRYFDFGGYNHMVDESDQVYNINRFKDGFTKEYLYYPRLMYFEFVPNALRLLETSQKLKDIVKKVIRR